MNTRKRKSLTPRQRWKIMKRDGFRCVYCGVSSEESMLVIDHVVPFAKGGDDSPDNFHTACEKCNAGKRDEHLVATQKGLAVIEPWGMAERDWLHALLAKGTWDVRAFNCPENGKHDLFFPAFNSYEGQSIKYLHIGEGVEPYFREFDFRHEGGGVLGTSCDFFVTRHEAQIVTDFYTMDFNDLFAPLGGWGHRFVAKHLVALLCGYERDSVLLFGAPKCFVGIHVTDRYKGMLEIELLDESLRYTGEPVCTGYYIDEDTYPEGTVASMLASAGVNVSEVSESVTREIAMKAERIRNGI